MKIDNIFIAINNVSYALCQVDLTYAHPIFPYQTFGNRGSYSFWMWQFRP